MLRRAVIAGLLLWSASAPAADMTVQVYDKASGEALAGVAVCLGTPANPTQFGAFRSDAGGAVAFLNLPRSTHLLTVSVEGYRGISRLVEALNADRVLRLDLARGGGGPRCAAPRAITTEAEADGPGITRFTLDGGALRTPRREVALQYQVDGSVNQYRASESPDFVGAAWQDLAGTPRFTLSAGKGEKRVYFQVRRYRALAGGSLESRSSVVTDTIRLE